MSQTSQQHKCALSQSTDHYDRINADLIIL